MEAGLEGIEGTEGSVWRSDEIDIIGEGQGSSRRGKLIGDRRR